MPPPSKSGNSHTLKFAKVICLLCNEYIGRGQREKGKAVCERCESLYFNSNPDLLSQKMIPIEEYMEQQRKAEEYIFLKTMRKAFERLFE